MKVNDSIKYTVLRLNEQSEYKEVLLKAPLKLLEKNKKHVLEFNQNSTSDQLALRDAWLGVPEKK
jgi:hypothetical protein